MADAKQIHFRLNMSKGSTPGPQRHPNPMGSWNLCSVRRLLKIQGVQINRHISRHVNAFHIILPNLTKSFHGQCLAGSNDSRNGCQGPVPKPPCAPPPAPSKADWCRMQNGRCICDMKIALFGDQISDNNTIQYHQIN